MNTEQIIVPRIALLGVCDLARHDQGDIPHISHLHILGLRKIVFGYIYPLDLSHLYLALAVYAAEISLPGTIVLRNQEGNDVFNMQMTRFPLAERQSAVNAADQTPPPDILVRVEKVPSWTPFIVSLKGLVLNQPQNLEAFLKCEDEEMALGILSFGIANAPPLTPDRIAAIKSDPRAVKAIRCVLGCKYCNAKLKVIASLEKSDRIDLNGVWYQDLPDEFTCDCGRTKTPLNILRTNMHTLLGKTDIVLNNFTFSTLYQVDTIDHISEEFLKLVQRSPREEDLQRYLSCNPIIFHFLSPVRLFEKPPLLSKHKADFAILDSRGTLIFIEIERPDILLLRQDGAASAEVEHAISQVRDWLYLYERHRSAVLECLDLPDHMVTRVRGIVVAGRDGGYDSDNLRKFKWQDRGAIDILTYDDLLSKIAALSREMKKV